MVSPVVSYPPGGRSPAHHHTRRHSSTLTSCQVRFEARLMTNAGMIAAGIEIMRRIFFSAIHEFTADLRFWKSESNSAPADAENTE
jgi:hypothetical protein